MHSTTGSIRGSYTRESSYHHPDDMVMSIALPVSVCTKPSSCAYLALWRCSQPCIFRFACTGKNVSDMFAMRREDSCISLVVCDMVK